MNPPGTPGFIILAIAAAVLASALLIFLDRHVAPESVTGSSSGTPVREGM